jgi:hypothetical protein
MQLHTTPHNYLFSLRSGFTAYFGLSPVTGFLATVDRSSVAAANLAPASGRQDHTTSPSTIFLRSSSQAIRVHRIPPRVRDVRNAPLIGWDARS